MVVAPNNPHPAPLDTCVLPGPMQQTHSGLGAGVSQLAFTHQQQLQLNEELQLPGLSQLSGQHQTLQQHPREARVMSMQRQVAGDNLAGSTAGNSGGGTQ